jgi:hypothetical protein
LKDRNVEGGIADMGGGHEREDPEDLTVMCSFALSCREEEAASLG